MIVSVQIQFDYIPLPKRKPPSNSNCTPSKPYCQENKAGAMDDALVASGVSRDFFILPACSTCPVTCGGPRGPAQDCSGGPR